MTKLFSTREVAELIGRSRDTVNAWVRMGLLQPAGRGRRGSTHRFDLAGVAQARELAQRRASELHPFVGFRRCRRW
jgi:DNA-binding transcriptional MerR regulator